MYDRPSLEDLLDAVRMHLETRVVPTVRADRKLYFQTLVAVNVLKIAGRELEHGADHARAEWERLNTLTGRDDPAPESLSALKAALTDRNSALAESIRAGDYDTDADALFTHLQATVIEQLEVANPRFLGRLLQEATGSSTE